MLTIIQNLQKLLHTYITLLTIALLEENDEHFFC